MTIWRDVLIEVDPGSQVLAQSLADAFKVDIGKVDIGKVAVVTGGPERWPTKPPEIVADTQPVCGESRLTVTLFVCREPAMVERMDDKVVVQALADRIGCTVLLPDDGDTSPFSFVRFRPRATHDRVDLDPDGLDESPPHITVLGILPSLDETVAQATYDR